MVCAFCIAIYYITANMTHIVMFVKIFNYFSSGMISTISSNVQFNAVHILIRTSEFTETPSFFIFASVAGLIFASFARSLLFISQSINNLNNWIDNVTGETSGTGDDSQTSETWVLNKTLNLGTTAWIYNIEFSSDGVTGNVFSHHYLDGITDNLWYGIDNTENGAPVYLNNTWLAETFRTVTFSVPPTGALLTWLQQNGTKQ